MSRSPRPQMVLRTYERRSSGVPTGEYLTRKHDLAGNPFVVFCTHPDCPHWLEGVSALPHWSEDCPENLGVRRPGGPPPAQPRRPSGLRRPRFRSDPRSRGGRISRRSPPKGPATFRRRDHARDFL